MKDIYYDQAVACVKDYVLPAQYILNQLEPNTVFDVEILETVLRGADHCRFRITKDLPEKQK